MQTFESGGALLIRRRVPWRTLAMALGAAMIAAALPPAIGIYLLIVA